MKLAEAKKQLKEIGYTITLDKDINEYRVVPKSNKESQAYYTDDLEDAVGTAKFEVRRQEQIKKDKISIKDDDGNRVYWRDIKEHLEKSYTAQELASFDEKRIREAMRNFVSMY